MVKALSLTHPVLIVKAVIVKLVMVKILVIVWNVIMGIF